MGLPREVAQSVLLAQRWAGCSSVTQLSRQVPLGRAAPAVPVRHFTSPPWLLALAWSSCHCTELFSGGVWISESFACCKYLVAGARQQLCCTRPPPSSADRGGQAPRRWRAGQGLLSAPHATKSSEHFKLGLPPSRGAGTRAALGLRTHLPAQAQLVLGGVSSDGRVLSRSRNESQGWPVPGGRGQALSLWADGAAKRGASQALGPAAY